MATSGSTNHYVTRNDIIEDALWLIGALGESESPSSATYTKCSRMLNNMIKAWQAEGLNLWTISEGVVFLQEDKYKYSLNDTTGDWGASSDAVETSITADASSSATTITVTSTTGMIAGFAIVIENDDGTLTVDDIVSVNSATSITITGGLTGDASTGNRVTAYELTLDRVLQVTSARYKDRNDIERPLNGLTRQEYFDITNKSQEGTPTSYFYDPQLNTGYFYVWPMPSSSQGLVNISYIREIEDFDSASDAADFPVEWSEALTYNLALRIAPAYGKGDDAVQTIGPMAQAFKTDLLNWDNEKESVYIVPDCFEQD